ncbi:MAG: hypothetical protein K2W96_17465 [Gemmataceae bacterium]|nr:hypothetical protein [Gemmataceae bacterium]
MGYQIEWMDSVRLYITTFEHLPVDDRHAVIADVEEELSRSADYFFRTRPLRHESFHFRYDCPRP